MGWWGTGVLQGDPPYDVIADLEGEFGEELENLTPQAAIEFINGHLLNEFDPGVPAQVVGYIMMANQKPINEELRQLVIQGANDDESECWLDEAERKKAMNNLIAAIESYPLEGGEVELDPQTGLFDTIISRLQEERDNAS